MLLEVQDSGLSFLPVELRKDLGPLCPSYVSLSLPWLCSLCRLLLRTTHLLSRLLQYLSAVILTCITLSFPGMYSIAASLKLLAPLIPLKPQRLPLAFSHDSSVVVFIVWGLIFSKAPRAPVNTSNPRHAHTDVETDFTWFLLMHFSSLLFFSSSLSLIISGVCNTMALHFSRHLNVLS